MKITIFGSGYVGLVTAACFADTGNDVLCIDIDQYKINKLKDGIIPIYEPGLEDLLCRNAESGRIRFCTDAEAGVKHGQFIFIAVGTPPGEDGSADLRHVLTVAQTIGQFLDTYKVIIDKSTVPVGTADKVRQHISDTLSQRGESIEFDVVSNPEFLKEGAAINDFMKPDRIVVGSDSDKSIQLMKQLYAPYNRNHERLIIMDVRSAELTKYAANAMLATKISFMNEMANIAELVGADIELVRRGIGSDPRIGYHFIYPGCGYGGSCFPKDVNALTHTAKEFAYTPKLINAVEQVNASQKHALFRKISDHFNDDITDKTIAVWGLAFKPGTDDMREASSTVLIERLLNAGACIQAYDPKALDEARLLYADNNNVKLLADAKSALKNADVLVIVTEWSEFRSPDFDFIKESLAEPTIFDGRNLYEPATMTNFGFTYYGIGRSNKSSIPQLITTHDQRVAEEELEDS